MEGLQNLSRAAEYSSLKAGGSFSGSESEGPMNHPTGGVLSEYSNYPYGGFLLLSCFVFGSYVY